MPMIRTVLLVCAAGVLTACQQQSAPAAATTSDSFDVLITNGRVVDGTGAPWYHADIGIVGDRIAAIGQLAGREAKTRVDRSEEHTSELQSQSNLVCRLLLEKKKKKKKQTSSTAKIEIT